MSKNSKTFNISLTKRKKDSLNYSNLIIIILYYFQVVFWLVLLVHRHAGVARQSDMRGFVCNGRMAVFPLKDRLRRVQPYQVLRQAVFKLSEKSTHRNTIRQGLRHDRREFGLTIMIYYF
jgi:hypothetical protein